MKKNISYLSISAMAFLLCFASCKKDKDSDVTPANPCKVAEVKGANDQLLSTSEYSSDGKITKLTDNTSGVYTTYDYDSAYVRTYTFGPNGLQGTSKIEVNKNGYAAKSFNKTIGSDSIIYDSVYYQYNNDGYLTKKTIYTYIYNTLGEVLSKDAYVTTYEVSGGNVLQSTYFKLGESMMLYISKYDYDTSVENKSGIDITGSKPNPIPTGKSTKNPVTKVTYPFGLSDEISYSYDDKGNVTEVRTKHNTLLGSTESTSKVSYICQ
ncbi:hypothetical protein MYP_1735 [Sporocytophaga myxococcoides]|uniref:YD repeat-containing protein n=1 Tax=Sporocytophaga myxococcoides TaxID=153721 RepID=A0A098LDI8_9BACT|nr:hypothetical protein [Sporocytophaga myxococcoides]GAL84507.1 hypothetical protein MYP_1735 [Sporocytophaga myxococcoides]